MSDLHIDQRKMVEEVRLEIHALLRWWIKYMYDKNSGKFHGKSDHDNQIVHDAPKGVVMYARLLWTFSAAAQFLGHQEYAEIAENIFNYFKSHFFDPKDGGVYWMLDHHGQPTRTRKQMYAQAFAIYGLVEYHQLSNDPAAKKYAIELYELIEKYSRDKVSNGYWEAFGQEWQPIGDVRLSEKDANEAKTMNTHLHILEAYTNLLRINPVADIHKSVRNLVILFIKKIINSQTGHMTLFFGKQWEERSSEISFGHDIEASWLLWEAVEALDDASLQAELKPIILAQAKAVLTNGRNKQGFIINAIEDDRKRDESFDWWPQAEAVIGFLNAFEITGKEMFWEASWQCWDNLKNYFRHPQGEWYWGFDTLGNPNIKEDKAGPWKAPYHSGRMCLEVMRRLSSSQASS